MGQSADNIARSTHLSHENTRGFVEAIAVPVHWAAFTAPVIVPRFGRPRYRQGSVTKARRRHNAAVQRCAAGLPPSDAFRAPFCEAENR